MASLWILVLLSACPPLDGSGEPRIELLQVPAFGQTGNVSGRVSHVRPADCRVAIYVYLDEQGGWWTRPSFLDPVVKIRDDGTWTANVIQNDDEAKASRIAVFLIDKKKDPALFGGVATFPDTVFQNARAYDAVYRTTTANHRLLFFSGREWRVKSDTGPVGPGPNWFSASHDNVWTDQLGRLHLRIAEEGGRFRCAEIISLDNPGYGEYVFHLDSPVAQLDKNVVLGLFTWSDAPEFNHREIDIEFARWGDAANDNAQFVIQPYDISGNMERFNLTENEWPTVHGFDWQYTYVHFTSRRGVNYDSNDPATLIHEWHYNGDDIPREGDENVRMNLWLTGGAPPSNGEPAEVVVSAFEFRP